MYFIPKYLCRQFELTLLNSNMNLNVCTPENMYSHSLLSFCQRIFQRIVLEYQRDNYVKSFSCWNQLLVMMFGQLAGCDSLRELISVLGTHRRKS